MWGLSIIYPWGRESMEYKKYRRGAREWPLITGRGVVKFWCTFGGKTYHPLLIHSKIWSYTSNLKKKVLKWFYVNPKELPNHLVAFVVYKRFPIHSDMNFPTHPLTINDLAPYHALNNHIYYFECLPSLRAILFMLGRSD